ncbi:protein IMPACT-like [Pollicipes pollicipes]|uniref:protein IMPACT-like n=1 Tax=Pollicipes pollicipes TaxID=41117 RepID=UPI001884D711|nr:protein IMPACT-like [Pollicipes pollicipes]
MGVIRVLGFACGVVTDFRRTVFVMDNIALQADEVQALSAIYEQEWQVISEPSRIYAVVVGVDSGKKVTLEVTLPSDYPLEAPPQYQLLAPWLRGSLRHQLGSLLDTLYWENMGSSILYLWIERIKEFLEDLRDGDDSEEPAPPAPAETPALPPSDEDAQPCPEITHGECIMDRKSVFQGHCAIVRSVQQVRQVVARLKENRKVAAAAHNMWAYRIGGATSGAFQQDCDDDGETHAGARMLHLLEDVVVVVSRWFGGILLGPDRFRHINNATRGVPDKKKH